MRWGMTKPDLLSSVDNRYDGSVLTDMPQYFIFTDFVRQSDVFRPFSVCKQTAQFDSQYANKTIESTCNKGERDNTKLCFVSLPVARSSSPTPPQILQKLERPVEERVVCFKLAKSTYRKDERNT